MKNSKFCTNCGSHFHYNKYCREPKISCGIILLKFPKEIEITELFNPEGIRCESENDIRKWNDINNSLMFLLVKQKYTYGYCDFIRGKYNISNVDNIAILFSQMTLLEKEMLKTKLFDNLWDDFWGGDKIRKQFETEYNEAKEKFEQLKNNNDMGLNFYIINCTNGFLEWGFPKGRRNNQESDLECAMREFEEETGITKDFYKIMNIESVFEKYIGTNGIEYKYKYFIAIAKDNLEIHNRENNEIGSINFFKYHDTTEILHENFVERKKLINKIYLNVVNQLLTTYEN
jgi:ADP-ribose pyrophosphatase YjhB (NUDIX family)